MAMVHIGKLGTVLMGSLLVGHLTGRWLDVIFMHCCLFPCVRAPVDPTRAIKTVMIVISDEVSVDISIMDKSSVYPHYRRIIHKMPTGPAAAIETIASIAETIVKATIETYARAPITGIKAIYAA